MSNEYTIKQVEDSETWDIIHDGLPIGTATDKHEAAYWAMRISTEAAPLHETIATQAAALEAKSAEIAELKRFRDTLQASLRTMNAENERYKAALIELRNLSFPDEDSGSLLIYQECTKALTETASLESVEGESGE